jgi:hypothetical protein
MARACKSSDISPDDRPLKFSPSDGASGCLRSQLSNEVRTAESA